MAPPLLELAIADAGAVQPQQQESRYVRCGQLQASMRSLTDMGRQSLSPFHLHVMPELVRQVALLGLEHAREDPPTLRSAPADLRL